MVGYWYTTPGTFWKDQLGMHDTSSRPARFQAEELLKEYLHFGHFMYPQKWPVGSSEFVGGTFESFFRQIRWLSR